MASHLAQFKYKYPNETDISDIFENSVSDVDIVQTGLGGYPIISLGVQAEPGLILIINDKEILVGPSGIYQLYNSPVKITSLKIKEGQHYLKRILIDIIYDKGE